ncbi:TPA: hypothetical protein ACPYPV_000548 [Legionella pneumophila]
MNQAVKLNEHNILCGFFESISTMSQCDSTISDSKIIKDTKNQLKIALRDVLERCSCARRSYDICEVCQGSDRELVDLRNFFRTISNAKKYNMTNVEIQTFIENTKNNLLHR